MARITGHDQVLSDTLLAGVLPFLTSYNIPDVAKATGVKEYRLSGWINRMNHLLPGERVAVTHWLRGVKATVMPFGHNQYKTGRNHPPKRPAFFRDRLDGVFHHLARAALAGWTPDHVRMPNARLELLQWCGQEIEHLREQNTKLRQEIFLLQNGVKLCQTQDQISSSVPVDPPKYTPSPMASYVEENGTRKPPSSAPGSPSIPPSDSSAG